MYTIAQLKIDLTGILRGTSLNKVVGINDVISRAARHVIADVDLPETKRTTQLTNPIFDQVYDYVLPADLKGSKIIDIRPLNNRSLFDDYPTQSYSKDFDFLKGFMTGNMFNIRNNSGIKTIRVSDSSVTPRVTINSFDSLTANGTWTAGGGLTTPTLDTLQYISGTGAFRSTSTGLTGYIESANMTALDLSAADLDSIFLWVYVTDVSLLTSINLRWGSSAANYYNRTVAASHTGAFVNGWNLVRFDWDGATQVGTPVDTAVTYARITLNHTAALGTIRFDSLTNNKGRVFEMEYYSKYMFRSSAGVWQETVLADTDYVNADTDSYNLLLYKVAELVGLDIEESLVTRSQRINIGQSTNGSMYDQLLRTYKGTYKSEAIVMQQRYYNMPYTGRRTGYHG